MYRFVKPLSKAAAAGLFIAAMGVPGLAFAAGTAATTAMPAKATTKSMVTKTSAKMTTKPMATKKVAELDTDHWSARVKSVQQALDKGGAALRVDGIWGPRTQAAIMKYQKAHGLKATGHVNKATWQSLKIG